jgi:Rieske 2Fe-2S family protein
MQRRKYLFFKHKTLLPWFFVLDLKSNTFFDRNLDLGPWNDIINQLPYTKQCIESLPFSQIGRVVIYGSWPEASVPCHRDWIPDGEFHHHINFNPGGYRPVYIYDPTTNTKHHLPNDYKLYAYQTTDYHGVDPLPYFSYTIRVDGIFNSDVKL